MKKAIKNDGMYGTDPFATEAACTEIQWCWPADFDLSDDSPDARHCTGWFWRKGTEHGNDIWMGPHKTSSEALDALAEHMVAL